GVGGHGQAGARPVADARRRDPPPPRRGPDRLAGGAGPVRIPPRRPRYAERARPRRALARPRRRPGLTESPPAAAGTVQSRADGLYKRECRGARVALRRTGIRMTLAMQPSLDEILENFELLDEWDDRYRYLIELGRTLEPLPEEARTDANKVRGCASQVWLDTRVVRQPGQE